MTTKTPPRIYMSIPQAAEHLSVSEDYLRSLINDGRIACFEIGSSARKVLRVRIADVEALPTPIKTWGDAA
ncbi:helix-turn-helix domain-containing protein [Propionibacterium freudenreichii]|uniref:helix-turn-helix domain-containing protein n=2 Tax=Propionibacterium freudenreichii TaxID=1744 RepID=UPI003851C564